MRPFFHRKSEIQRLEALIETLGNSRPTPTEKRVREE